MTLIRLNPRAKDQRIYALSAIARPVDPRYPSNRALLFALPAIAILRSAHVGLTGGSLSEIIAAALGGIFVFFGCWALTRELLVDLPAAAFISAVLALGVLFLWPLPSLIILFALLLQVRVVNRSVGPPATLFDSIAVSALTLTAVVLTETPLFWLSGSLAFILDAICAGGRKRQWIFAAVCTLGGIAYALQNSHLMGDLAFLTLPEWTMYLGIIAILLVIGALRINKLDSLADASGDSLAINRVRAAMIVALIGATTPLFGGLYALKLVSILWTTLAVTAVGAFFIRRAP